MEQKDLARLRQYCDTEWCGRPTPTPDGGVVIVKLPMIFTKFSEDGHAEYICPQCSKRREFALNPSKDGFEEVKSEELSVGFFITLLVMTIGMAGCISLLQSLGF